MKLGLAGRTALVTGGSAGIGKAAALALAQEGAAVVVASRTTEKLEKACREISDQTGVSPRAEVCDVTDLKALRKLVAGVEEVSGGLDILINNAGGPAPGVLSATSFEDWEEAWRLSLMSVVVATKEALPAMRSRKWGRVISVTSVVAQEPSPGMVLSATYRAGVAAFTKAIAAETAPDGVTANAVLPSAVLTDRARFLIGQQAEQDGVSFEDALAKTESGLPMKRFATSEEMGSLIAFLCSENAGYVSGRNVVIDGCVTKGL